MSDYVLNAELRTEQGKGASRRLRKLGKIPAIIYGADKDPVMISLQHNQISRFELDGEHFFFSILDIDIDGNTENVLIRDYQRHPYKPQVVHIDFLRVNMKEQLKTTVPLHFVGEEDCVGVKAGGKVAHNISDVEITCMPGNLPEHIEIDVANLNIGESVSLSEITMPEGIELVVIANAKAEGLDDAHFAEIDQVVVSVTNVSTASDDSADVATDEADAASDDS